jgi:release factor glutamine methyltransferase
VPPNTTSKTVQELLLEGKRFLAAAHSAALARSVDLARPTTRARSADLATSAAQAHSAAVPRAPEAIASPALDAALLLAEVSGLSREKLITHNEHVLDEARRARYFELLERRAGGECIAYILGRKEFWGLELAVTPAVLVPRPDTEILVETALGILRAGSRGAPQVPRSALHAPVAAQASCGAEQQPPSAAQVPPCTETAVSAVQVPRSVLHVPVAAQASCSAEQQPHNTEQPAVAAPLAEMAAQTPRSAEHAPPTQTAQTPRRVLDLCTGSGAVALALKHECPELDVWASDLSEAALDIARTNAETLGLTVRFAQGDLFDALKNAGAEAPSGAPLSGSPRFSLITANAPYVPSCDIPGLPREVQNEPRLALDGGKDGLDLVRRIAAEASLFLEPGGSLALEADPSQMETIAALLKNSDFGGITLYRDLAGDNRVIAGKVAYRPNLGF